MGLGTGYGFWFPSLSFIKLMCMYFNVLAPLAFLFAFISVVPPVVYHLPLGWGCVLG